METNVYAARVILESLDFMDRITDSLNNEFMSFEMPNDYCDFLEKAAILLGVIKPDDLGSDNNYYLIHEWLDRAGDGGDGIDYFIRKITKTLDDPYR